jgi:hypothetical protein
MSMFERVQELTERVGRIENERARNITALVERIDALEQAKVAPGPPEHRDLVALDRHFDARCDTLSQRLDALEETRSGEAIGELQEAHQSLVQHVRQLGGADGMAIERRLEVLGRSETKLRGRIQALEELQQQTTEDMLEFHSRLKEFELRLPAAIPVVTPLAPRCPCEDGSLCALVPGSKAHPHPRCVRCNGTVEPERHDYAQPTCYRCLPPPEPLPVRAVTPLADTFGPAVAPQNLALPDYLLAPAPDYSTERPAEVETNERQRCSCHESEWLRSKLRAIASVLEEVYP